MMNKLTKSLLLALTLTPGLCCAQESSDVNSLRAKAMRGNAVAQYNLGRLLADKQAPLYDRAEAYVWFKLASENGSTGNELNLLIEQMTPADISEGRRRLQERRSQLAALRSEGEIPASTAPVVAQAAAQDPAALARVERELSETRATARQLALKSQQLEDVASERGRSLQAAQAENAELKQRLASVATTSTAASTATEQANQIAALQADRELLRRQLNEAQVQARKLGELPERVARAERDVSLLNKKNLELADKAQRAHVVEQELGGLREKLLAEQKRVQDLTGSAAQLAIDNERIRRELTVKQEADPLPALREKVAALEKQNLELGARATAVEAKQSVPAPALATAVATAPSADTSELQAKLTETETKLATALRSYSLLQQELEQARTSSTQAGAEAEAKLTTAQSEISALKGQLAAVSTESQERAAALDSIQKELGQLRTANINAGMEVVSLREQLRQSQSQMASVTSENAEFRTRLALRAPSPDVSRPTPTRPGTPQAQAAITLPPVLTATLAATKAEQAASAPRTHIIGEGDTLSIISKNFYGTPSRWKAIFEANRDIIADANRLPKGALIKIP